MPLAAAYVIAAFIGPSPVLRIVLRSLPLLPVAIWTIWFDAARPLQQQPATIRVGGRVVLLLLVMAFALIVLGLGLNWLYDPNRIF